MTKSAWESRVGMLLDSEKHPEFFYSYKPVDGIHGGQPKIDWFACDKIGRFWMIEVKWLPTSRVSINLGTEVTAGQRDGLDAVAVSEMGVALLAVGQGACLFLFEWREVQLWQLDQIHRSKLGQDVNRLLPLDAAFMRLEWNGPKSWKNLNLFRIVGHLHFVQNGDPSATTPTEPVVLSPKPGPSRPILRRKDSTRIVPLMRPLEP